MSSVTVESLFKRFGSFSAIRGANLRVEEGDFITLLGESGCGKTTTLRCIAGLETPTSGRISIGERIVYDGRRRVNVQPERRRVGMVFQSYALWPHLTVVETVLYPLKRRGVRGKEAITRAKAILDTVGLAAFATRPATSLSGGQQQRVALARALVTQPDLLLYDEPLSNLDPSLRRQVRDEILRLHRLNGATSVYVTHDLEEAMHLSDRIIVLEAGRLEQSGTPAEVFARPANEFVARFVGFENLLDAEVLGRTGEGIEVNVLALAARITLPLTTATGHLNPGDRALLAFRSSNARVVTDPAQARSDLLQVRGVISRVDFLGSRNEFGVAAGSTSLRVTETERDFRHNPWERTTGRDAWVEVDTDLCSLIPINRREFAASSESAAAQMVRT